MSKKIISFEKFKEHCGGQLGGDCLNCPLLNGEVQECNEQNCPVFKELPDLSNKDDTIEEILKKHNVYSQDLELHLLRYFDKLRLEMLESIKEPRTNK